VLGIARNVFREWLRSGRRELPVGELVEQPAPGEDGSIEVAGALTLLDPDDREVLVLRFVVGLSSRETASALGITDAAVRQRVFRAKAVFRKVWES
jgi:RNA polymerase sigma-70 factor (ECF subfamily)